MNLGAGTVDRRSRWIRFGRVMVWVAWWAAFVSLFGIAALILDRPLGLEVPRWMEDPIAFLSIAVFFVLTALIPLNQWLKGQLLVRGVDTSFSWSEIDTSDIERLREPLDDYQRATLTIRRLRWRSRSLRHQATAMLVLISLTVAFGMLVVIFAGYLTSLDTSGSQLQLVDQHSSATRTRLEGAALNVDRKRNLLGAAQEAESKALDASPRDARQIRDAQALREQRAKELADAQAWLMEARQALADADQVRLDALRHFLGLAGEKDAAFRSATKESSLLIASGITRFGVIAIVLFFVALLMGLYRYMSRLSAFYDGVADTLVLAGGDTKRASSLVAWIAPRAIDMEKPPSSPIQAIANATTEVLRTGTDQIRRNSKSKVDGTAATNVIA